MRELTQQEIEMAASIPSADHYAFVGGELYFTDGIDVEFFDAKGNRVDESIIPDLLDAIVEPIPHKTFKHWCDPTSDNDGHSTFCYYDEISRDKAIEIAKHFKLI